MKTLELHMLGTRPLFLHNAEKLLNPFDPTNREKKMITDKRTKQTDEDRTNVAKLEWVMGWHFDQVLGPILPTSLIYASLNAAAKKTRDGAKFRDAVNDATEGGVSILQYDGPRELEALWGEGLAGSPFVDYRPVGQQSVKIMRCRPKLPQWECTSIWNLDEEILNVGDFIRFADTAGRYCGVGDYRLVFGRFEAEVKEI